MKTSMLPLTLLAACSLPTPLTATDAPPPTCKPVKVYGVSGCELLPDHTCPPGYHKQVVNPPDPRMKAPSRLMCVPDKPGAEKPPSQEPSKPQSDEKPNS